MDNTSKGCERIDLESKFMYAVPWDAMILAMGRPNLLRWAFQRCKTVVPKNLAARVIFMSCNSGRKPFLLVQILNDSTPPYIWLLDFKILRVLSRSGSSFWCSAHCCTSSFSHSGIEHTSDEDTLSYSSPFLK